MATEHEIIAAKDSWLAVLAGASRRISQDVHERLACCSRALDVLSERYRKIGYPVESFRTSCEIGLADRILKIESVTAVPVPEILREFWSVVGGVSFVDLSEYQHVDFWRRSGIRGRFGFGDGVCVWPCDDVYFSYVEGDQLERSYRLSEGDEVEPIQYDISPDGYHKDDISGGRPYGVKSQDAWSPPLTDFAWTGFRRPQSAVPDPSDFLSYLRSAILECAGFPGYLGDESFEGLRGKLVDGLPTF